MAGVSNTTSREINKEQAAVHPKSFLKPVELLAFIFAYAKHNTLSYLRR